MDAKQDDALRAFGHPGAAGVVAAIERECGVSRSVRAVEIRASRIDVSLRVQQVCPECGGHGASAELAERDVRAVHGADAPQEEIAFNEILQAEREAAADEDEVAGIRRERDKMRQRNSRLCRKHGLKCNGNTAFMHDASTRLRRLRGW